MYMYPSPSRENAYKVDANKLTVTWKRGERSLPGDARVSGLGFRV